jgi:hypothetical protein
MQTRRNKVIAFAAIVILAAVGFLINSHQAAAQGPPSGLAVNIVNPLPVPISGSLTSTVTGTVSLAPGTTVGLASGASVHLNNTVTDPVRVRNVNDAIQPFQASTQCSTTADGCSGQISVPAGKRAVIEYFSGSASITGGAGQIVFPEITTTIGGAAVDNLVPATSPTVSFEAFGIIQWGQQVRLYSDSGATVLVHAFRSGIGMGAATFTFGITGYLVDVPFTP